MKTWQYLNNQFLSITYRNYKKMLKLSNYHDAYLYSMMTQNPGDPDWAMLYNRYHPFHQEYVTAYNIWKARTGSRQGETLNLVQLLQLLIAKVNKWEALIQAVDGFEKGTPNYRSLFSKGFKIFNSGAKATRVAAVNTLSEGLTPFALTTPAIAAVKVLVDDFYTLLEEARDTQEGAKGGTKLDSAEVEAKRKAVAVEQYRDLGFLINKGAEMPAHIAPFFELNVLRKHNQVLFTGSLDANETEAILIHTFVADDEINLKLNGSGQAAFYLADTPGGTNSTAITVAGGAKQKHSLSEFGITEWGTHRYLTGVNTGGTAVHFEIELL